MSEITSEARLIGWLQAAGLPAYGDVPARRPERFVTVERTGGSIDAVFDRPTWAVQVWSTSRAQASEDALVLAARLADADSGFLAGAEVCDVDVESIYDFPDPDSGQNRYQMTVTALIHN
jgi:hypothetical protein